MIDLAISAAREAGGYLLSHVGKVRHVTHKDSDGKNLVSEIDRGSEKMIIAMIRSRYPDHEILAEEGGTGGHRSEYRWVIDPLDGTTNYLHGIPLYCVTIGLERNGELIAGVVFDPTHNELFTAERGRGAFLNGSPVHVSATSTLTDSVVVTGFPYNVAANPDNAIERFVGFLKASRGVRRLGSAALDLCWVAVGRFDGFWEVNLHPWDVAGGTIIVQEAGGRVTDFAGASAPIDGKQVVASNGTLHDAMLSVLRSAGASGAST